MILFERAELTVNIVFMGTPDFAVPCLKTLIKNGHDVTGVFCQPDKPKGRGYVLTPPPVKVEALKHDLPVFQPQSMKDGSALAVLKSISPELIVTAAYGKILPQDILSLPKYGCINIHASLLPKYRGAAPIQWCVINGEKQTGVTSMLMDVGLDTGDMLISKTIAIPPEMTAGELHDKLSVLGAEVLEDTLEALENGTLVPVKQDDSSSSYAPMLSKELCPIDWNESAESIHNKIRGLSPWPVASTKLNGKTLKIHKARPSDMSGEAGEVIESTKRFIVACGDLSIELLNVQLEGKRAMDSEDFLRGNAVKTGTRLE